MVYTTLYIVMHCLTIGYFLRYTSLGHFVIVRTAEFTYTNLGGIAYYTPRLHGIPPLYMRSVIDWNVIIRCTIVSPYVVYRVWSKFKINCYKRNFLCLNQGTRKLMAVYHFTAKGMQRRLKKVGREMTFIYIHFHTIWIFTRSLYFLWFLKNYLLNNYSNY